MIEANNLEKRFGKVRAVNGISFRAEDGCVTGLLGPNGAGKTTALRIVYGLVKADVGSAHIDGIDVAANPRQAQAQIGVLPDARGLYPRLTAREHIRYFGELHGLSGSLLAERVEDLVQTLDMRDIIDRPAQGFSQGERAKVAIARALVHRPQNVILDEPTNGLDVMSTRAMRALINRLREEGRCVIFSSHLMQEVAALCDHIVVVARGRVVAEGDQNALIGQMDADTLEDAFVRAIEAPADADAAEEGP